MTSVATGIGVCCAVGLNMAAVIALQTPPPPNPKPPLQTGTKATEAEITMTGCLVQGSAASVFILQNAKRDPQSATEQASRYVVVPATEDLILKPHLNHQVRILGVPDGRPQPTAKAGSPVDEKLVPVLNAKSLTMVSASCGGGGGGGDWDDADASSGNGSGYPGVPGSGGGSIGLGSGAPGFYGSPASLASTTGSAGGPDGLFGDVGFATTSSVTGAFTEGAPSTGVGHGQGFVGGPGGGAGGGTGGGAPASSSPSAGSGQLAALDGGAATAGSTPAAEHIPAFAAATVADAGPRSHVLEALMGNEPPSPAVQALMSHVARTTATELLGEDAPEGGLETSQAALDQPIVNPEPGTLLLIASGLLLVVYAGRRRDWRRFGSRSAR